jgi:hypothetical protein
MSILLTEIFLGFPQSHQEASAFVTSYPRREKAVSFLLLHLSWWYSGAISLLLRYNFVKIKLTNSAVFSPQANYTDRETDAFGEISNKLLQVEGCRVVSATGPHAH